MIGILAGLAYANASEWLIHKYALHGLGKRKGSVWAFHWHQHHREVRRNGMRDVYYEQSPFHREGQRKEVIYLTAASLAHLPLFPLAPLFTTTVVASSVAYYFVHRRAHVDVEWGRKYLPWHYDHHMGPDQDANWCVTFPWFDHVMGTRVPYLGTEAEAKRRSREAEARARVVVPAV